MKIPELVIYRIVALIASAWAGFTEMGIIGQGEQGFACWDGEQTGCQC